MGFVDKKRTQIQAANAKRADNHQRRGKKLDEFLVEFAGGYENHKKASGTLCFYENVIEFKPIAGATIVLDHKDIVDILADDRPDEKHKGVFVALVRPHGVAIVFYARETSPRELRRRLTAITRRRN